MAKKENSFAAILDKFATQKESPRYDVQPGVINDLWDGVHLGTMYSMWGPAGCGKTTLLAQTVRSLCKKGLKGVYIDVEKAFNPNQIESFGLKPFVDDGTLVFITIENMQQLEEVVVSVREADINFLAIDSITMVRPYTPNEQMITDIRPGLKALQEAQVINKLKDACYYKNIAVFLLCHARANIQIQGPSNPYASATKQAGGFALLHTPDVITQIGVNAKEKDPDGNIVGCTITLQTTKNKWRPPFTPRKEVLYYGKGIDAKMSLIKKALELGVIERPTTRSYRLPFEADKNYNSKTIWQLTPSQCKELKTYVDNFEASGE